MQSLDLMNAAMGQAAKGALTQAGLRQVEAAPLLDLSVMSLSRRINGALPFTYPELKKLSDITGVPLTEIVIAAERILERMAA